MAEILRFPQKQKHPKPGLEKFRAMVEYQKTAEFKNWIGYYEAIAKQRVDADDEFAKSSVKLLNKAEQPHSYGLKENE